MRIAAIDVSQSVESFSYARIRMSAHDDCLQLRRIPSFIDDFDLPLIADFASRNGDRRASTFRLNAINGLLAECLRVWRGNLFLEGLHCGKGGGPAGNHHWLAFRCPGFGRQFRAARYAGAGRGT